MTHDVEACRTPEKEDKAASERRPYVAPRLRAVGSVRELTMGSGGHVPDGGPNKGRRG